MDLENKNIIKIILPTGKINPVFVKAVKKILDQKYNYCITHENISNLKNELPALWKFNYASTLNYDENLKFFKSIEFESQEDLTFFLLKNGI